MNKNSHSTYYTFQELLDKRFEPGTDVDIPRLVYNSNGYGKFMNITAPWYSSQHNILCGN